jgi:transcriptional regulator with XRE-family HTH domain
MRQRAVSQSELARQIGTSPTTVWKLLNEPAQGSKHLHKIARVLGTSPEYLMDETSDSASIAPPNMFTAVEVDILEKLRLLTPNDRKAVITLVRSLANSAHSSTVHTPQSEFRGEP